MTLVQWAKVVARQAAVALTVTLECTTTISIPDHRAHSVQWPVMLIIAANSASAKNALEDEHRN